MKVAARRGVRADSESRRADCAYRAPPFPCGQATSSARAKCVRGRHTLLRAGALLDVLEDIICLRLYRYVGKQPGMSLYHMHMCLQP